MAYIGLRKPVVAPRENAGSYGEPFAFGKLIGLQVTPSFAEGSLYADDMQAEYDKEFSYAEVTLNTSTIPILAYRTMFGHAVDAEKQTVQFNANDENGYVGVGWVSIEKIDGVRVYTGNFLYKAKFSEPNEDYATKGENIEYKTPSISGRALAEDNGEWKETQCFDTWTEALSWIYGKFGAEPPQETGALTALTVTSVAGAAAGKTKLTVTPSKAAGNSYVYKAGSALVNPKYDEVCSDGYTDWDGTTEITAATGSDLLVVEITAEKKARKAGIAKVTAKS